jgi:hypothetical protein
MSAVVFMLYFLMLLWFFVGKGSPFHDWADNNPLISIPLFFILNIIGASVLVV